MAVADLPPGTMARVEVAGQPVCLANVEGTVLGVHDTCTHGMASMSAGWLEEDVARVTCPRHGAVFSLTDGAALTPPATSPLPVFRVEVVDGRVLVDPVPDITHPFDA